MTDIPPKRYGSTLPATIDTGSRICFTISINDQLEYRAALYGRISELCNWYGWQHTQADYQDIPERNREAATLWNESLFNAVWEECMSICEQVANCISTDDGTQSALRSQLLSDPTFLRQMTDAIGNGYPLSPTQITAPIGEICDRDQLWAGLVGVVQQMNRNNVDFLEKIEVLTNPVERFAGVTSQIKPLQLVGAVFDFVQTLFADITENYNAEYDAEYEDEITCQLFCLALSHEDNGCYLSFEDVFNVFKDRLVASFTVESQFADIIQFLATGTWSGTQVCDFMFMVQLSAIKVADKFLTSNLLSLQQMFDVGRAEPNTGWETLCTDCPDLNPRWQIYWIGSFEGQVPTYLGPDPSDASYDRWSIPAFDYFGAKYSYLGTTYNYGCNFKLAEGTDYFGHLFDAQGVSGFETTYTYTPDGFISGSQLPTEIDVGQGVSELFTNDPDAVCIFRIRPRV